MPITVQYNPNYVAGGMIAHGAGRGRFLQDQSRFDYQRLDADRKFDLAEDQFSEQQRQFDENLGQRQSEYDRSLQNRVNEAQRQENQYLQGLASREYLANQQLNQRALESDQYGQLARERMGLQAGMQERALGASAEQQARGFQFQERRDLRNIQQAQEQQQTQLSLVQKAALDKAIARGELTPNQAIQAKQQFMDMFGNLPMYAGTGGEYPTFQQPDPASFEARREATIAKYHRIGNGLFTEEELEFYIGEDGTVPPDKEAMFAQDRNIRYGLQFNKEIKGDELDVKKTEIQSRKDIAESNLEASQLQTQETRKYDEAQKELDNRRNDETALRNMLVSLAAANVEKADGTSGPRGLAEAAKMVAGAERMAGGGLTGFPTNDTVSPSTMEGVSANDLSTLQSLQPGDDPVVVGGRTIIRGEDGRIQDLTPTSTQPPALSQPTSPVPQPPTAPEPPVEQTEPIRVIETPRGLSRVNTALINEGETVLVKPEDSDDPNDMRLITRDPVRGIIAGDKAHYLSSNWKVGDTPPTAASVWEAHKANQPTQQEPEKPTNGSYRVIKDWSEYSTVGKDEIVQEAWSGRYIKRKKSNRSAVGRSPNSPERFAEVDVKPKSQPQSPMLDRPEATPVASRPGVQYEERLKWWEDLTKRGVGAGPKPSPEDFGIRTAKSKKDVKENFEIGEYFLMGGVLYEKLPQGKTKTLQGYRTRKVL